MPHEPNYGICLLRFTNHNQPPPTPPTQKKSVNFTSFKHDLMGDDPLTQNNVYIRGMLIYV